MAGDVEVKANLQQPFYVREIDSKCPKGYCLLVKKDKENANLEHCNKASNKNKEKAKSHNPFSANQPQAQASKKHQGWRRDPPATGVNATKLVKKDKDKAKDLSHVKCYTYKQKDYYASKCFKKAKN